MKQCTKCFVFKDEDRFSPRKKSADGLQYWCKDCINEASRKRYKAGHNTWRQRNPEKAKEVQRRAMFKHLYGITPEQFLDMLEDQDCLCYLCGEVMDPPCIDHNHDTGEVRHLLCTSCNTFLGRIESMPIEQLLRLLKYSNHCKHLTNLYQEVLG